MPGGNARDRRKFERAVERELHRRGESSDPTEQQPESTAVVPKRGKSTFSWQDAFTVVGVLLALGGIAEMPALVRILLFVAANVFLVVSFRGHSDWSTKQRWISSGGVTFFFAIVICCVLRAPHIPTAEENGNAAAKAIQKQDNSKTAAELECEVDALPIHIPPRESVQIMLLNQKMPNRGLFEAGNAGDKEWSWPNKDLLKKEHHKPGLVIYRCKASNEGTNNLLGVTIRFSVTFDDPKTPAIYPVIINPLAVGEPLTFYVVNECPVMATVILPATYTAQILGEDVLSTLPFLRPERNFGDQIMLFSPSSTNWTGAPCS